MKFAFTATIALLFMSNLAQAERQSERNAREEAARKALMGQDDDEVPSAAAQDEEDSPRTHGNTRINDDPLTEEDEDYEKPRKVYQNNEKELWIFGTPGTDDYRGDLTEDEIAEMEIMWEYDYAFSIIRGIMQGLTRGFYKNYKY